MRNNKKGFTIVELVIVIAVIAILAAVLIPTFSSITQSAKESAAMQQAKSGLNAVLALTGGSMPSGTIFAVTDDSDPEADYWFEYANNKLQITEIGTHTQKFKDNFCVYVSAKAIEETADHKNQLKENTAKLISHALGGDPITDPVDLGGLKGNSYYTATIGGKEVHVYYTSDIEDTMVILLGSGTVETPTKTETEAPSETVATPAGGNS